MTNKEKARVVLEEMEKLFPEAKSELVNWENEFQFLISVILSAQTTDAQVNKVTIELFKKYPDPQSLAKAPIDDVAIILRSVNYRNSKAKYIVNASKMIVEDFAGKPPLTVDELIKLPGVGTKSANVFLNDMYESNLGIGADTHIMRVSRRLGFTNNKTPEKIALDLQKLYPRADWHRVNTLFVLYGRYYCKARVKPEHSPCIFKERGWCSWCSEV